MSGMTCAHEHTEPVETSGTVVAHVCVDCLAELPANWGCPDCGWVDVRSFGDDGPKLIPGMPCPRHGNGQA